jgi:hypothetical protein
MSTRCPQCGFDPGHNHKRSNPDHARTFALVTAAYRNWPEQHQFQPQNAEHLRAWLICKAGPDWRNAQCTFLPDGSRDELFAIIRDVLKDNLKKFPILYRDGIAVISPKSMSFTAMSQAEFGRLRDAITDVIEAEIGCTVADLMQEAA